MKCPNGHDALAGAAFCPACGSIMAPAPAGPAAGWYADPLGAGGQRYWDGRQWQAAVMPSGLPTPSQSGMYAGAPQPKSSTIAIVLTIVWPGAGHLYLGLTKKGVPYVVANAIGVVIGLTVILFPVTILIWIVTLLMTVTRISNETDAVNHALARGQVIQG